ncbi:hypothetical protein KDL44_00905 [bacterium]|nr:hypothetical protein [bacterium]
MYGKFNDPADEEDEQNHDWTAIQEQHNDNRVTRMLLTAEWYLRWPCVPLLLLGFLALNMEWLEFDYRVQRIFTITLFILSIIYFPLLLARIRNMG